MLRNQRFVSLGSWEQLETASHELVRELLMGEARSGETR
jgi:hypothetical protein